MGAGHGGSLGVRGSSRLSGHGGGRCAWCGRLGQELGLGLGQQQQVLVLVPELELVLALVGGMGSNSIPEEPVPVQERELGQLLVVQASEVGQVLVQPSSVEMAP